MKTAGIIRGAVVLSCAVLAACGGGGGGGGSTTPPEGPLAPIVTTNPTWNFDDGTTQGLATTGLWHISDVRATSAPHSLRYADPLSGTYDTGVANSGLVVLPELTLGAAPVLNLQHFLANECSVGTTCTYDRLTINVSTDQGVSYTELVELNAADVFTADAIDLAAYANQSVTIAFSFDTGDEISNGYEGAYLDDISVTDSTIAHTVRVLGDGLVTDESGGEQSFTVVLNAQPAATVTIPVSSDTPAEGLVKGGSSPNTFVSSLNLTFTTANWNVPQTVTVKGVADGVIDTDQLYNIVLAAAVSNDTGYNGVNGRDVAVVNVNANDAACDGTNLALGDDDSRLVSTGFSFPFQGSNWSNVYIGSNGFLTFGASSTDFSESSADLLAGAPRIAALWHDLYPPAGGTISCSNTATALMVSYQNVPDFDNHSLLNNFTVTLNSDGSVVIAYGNVGTTNLLAGITQGGGAVDPGETNLSAALTQPKSGTVYELFSGGGTDDFDLSGQTLTFQ